MTELETILMDIYRVIEICVTEMDKRIQAESLEEKKAQFEGYRRRLVDMIDSLSGLIARMRVEKNLDPKKVAPILREVK